MATELYGVEAVVGASQASTPVSNATNLIFYGTAASGAVGEPILISGWADAVEKLGCASGDGYTLTDACLAAFQECNLKQIYVIPVANSLSPADSAYTNAMLNIADLWLKYGIIGNIFCAPRVQDAAIISALVTAAQKQDGKFNGVVVFDGIQDEDQIDMAGRPIISAITSSSVKTSSNKICICQWGYAHLKSGDVVSGAALRACRLALADMQNAGSLPSRCSGNLDIDIQAACIWAREKDITHTAAIDNDHVKITLTDTAYAAYNGDLLVEYTLHPTEGSDVSKSETVTFTAGIGVCSFDTSSLTSPEVSASHAYLLGYVDINAKEADLTQLSADGIDSFLNIGGGQYVTWGDHSAAFANGTISDEAGRFDNYMRMMYHITNRFQHKYRNVIDEKLTLKLRNDILSEENDYLGLIVSQGALIGSPRCVFSEAENSSETAQKGEFYFEDVITITPPAKYIKLKVIFSSEGYIVYQEAA